MGTCERRSQVVQATLNPVYNEELTVMVEKNLPKHLSIKIMDWDSGDGDYCKSSRIIQSNY